MKGEEGARGGEVGGGVMEEMLWGEAGGRRKARRGE